VHAAANGPEALALWQRLNGSIDLLVTDMVMPGGLSGRELAERLLAEKPALRIIICSGYSDEVLTSNGPLRGKKNFLQKPFDVHLFLRRVRECLDERK
jgi:CheY-like chemotaxis protein